MKSWKKINNTMHTHSYELDDYCSDVLPPTQQQPPFYGHYTRQPALAGTSSGFCGAKFSARMPLLVTNWQPAHSDSGEDDGVLLNSVICTVSIIQLKRF